jgi:membrane protease YdiL (CAAX protease family)
MHVRPSDSRREISGSRDPDHSRHGEGPSSPSTGASHRIPRNEPILVLVAVIALIIFQYLTRADTLGVYAPARGWTPLTPTPLPARLHFAAAALVLGVIPVLVAQRATGLSLAGLGLGAGRVRRGLLILLVGIPAAIVAGHIGAGSRAMRAVYPLDPALGRDGLPAWAPTQFLYFGAWEVIFRGVLLFGLRPRLGEGMANVVQTALSVTAHFGRALNETVAAFPAGLLFGWVDLRLRSIWYVAIIHWLIGASVDFYIVTGAWH